jgi:hypothetical protein
MNKIISDRFVLIKIITILSVIDGGLVLPIEAWADKSYLDNGLVKVGVNLDEGGSITYLSKSGTNDSLVNDHDLGRQIQQSYYSGPQPYDPFHNQSPIWQGFPWNPIQSGDAFGHPSLILAQTNTGQSLYVKCRPMQWALDQVPGECSMESWLALDGNVVIVHNRLINLRTDTTQQFPAFGQELPAVYTIGRLYRIFTYAGNSPFVGDAVTNFVTPLTPELTWRGHATESWAALVDSANWGPEFDLENAHYISPVLGGGVG